MTPAPETKKPNRWLAILKAAAFAAGAAIAQTSGAMLQSQLTTGAAPSWQALGTGAALSGTLGALGYLLHSPLAPKPE